MTDNEDKFDLGEFLGDNSGLFVVMGIFSAMAVYLPRIAQQSDDIGSELSALGVVTSLLIFLLMLILVFNEIKKEIGDFDSMIEEMYFFHNLPLFLFGLIAILLAIVIFEYVRSYSLGVVAVVLVILFGALYSVFLHSISVTRDLFESKLASISILGLVYIITASLSFFIIPLAQNVTDLPPMEQVDIIDPYQFSQILILFIPVFTFILSVIFIILSIIVFIQILLPKGYNKITDLVR